VLQGEGIEVIDVPTCRGEQAAEEGDLLVLGGGPEEAFEKAVPVLQQFAAPENVVRFGEVGTGQVAKTANNTLLWTTLVADYEVLRLARAYGLNLEQLRDVLERSSGDNWTLREWDWIYGKWAHKDMKITLEMADQQELSLPLSALTWQLVRDITEEDLNELR
jgi:3-hydroxyisobutyrate dehydrogenase-like beta-hydroxyacid dehydrogenase